MTRLTSSSPAVLPYQSLRRFSVAEYHRMIQTGILDEDDPVELLEGYVVLKMPRNPTHDGTIQLVSKRLLRVLPAGWEMRVQSAITLADSEPEPDIALVRGDERTYLTRHPGPGDVGLVVEVADTSLVRDRDDKGRVYARADIPVYWLVNLVDRRLEVFTAPSGPTPTPGYGQRQDFQTGDDVGFSLGGAPAVTVPVADLLP
jgi:Uma2 family endonuclease